MKWGIVTPPVFATITVFVGLLNQRSPSSKFSGVTLLIHRACLGQHLEPTENHGLKFKMLAMSRKMRNSE